MRASRTRSDTVFTGNTGCTTSTSGEADSYLVSAPGFGGGSFNSGNGSLILSDWSERDRSADEIAQELNGKLRGTIALPKDAPKEAAETAALAQPDLVRGLEGRTPKRVIVVPNRIVNVVV